MPVASGNPSDRPLITLVGPLALRVEPIYLDSEHKAAGGLLEYSGEDGRDLLPRDDPY